ncbi:MAG TPA: hypothetical protein VG324_07545, partial [Blastocatellia bacterium]|nr:hypothetical protein [Blastocatellia bacterium]
SFMKTKLLKRKVRAPSATNAGHRLFQFFAMNDKVDMIIERANAISASNGKDTGRTPLPNVRLKRIPRLMQKFRIADSVTILGIEKLTRRSPSIESHL